MSSHDLVMYLASLFESLPLPEMREGSDLTLSAVPVHGVGGHRIAKNSHGGPTLLLAVGGGTPSIRPIPLRLEQLSVQYGVQCRLLSPDGIITEGIYTVVQFTGLAGLRPHFLRVASTLLTTIGDEPTTGSIHEAVMGFVALFRALGNPPKKSVQGLWAELFVLVHSVDIQTVATAWHSGLDDGYDFNAGTERVEVKSTIGRQRKHRFSLEQLRPPNGVDLLIASVLLERSAHGLALYELVDLAYKGLADKPKLLARMDYVIAATLGDSLQRALEIGFDAELARDSLKFISHDQVPSVKEVLSTAITEVSFVSDLTGLPEISMAQYRDGLFAGIRQK